MPSIFHGWFYILTYSNDMINHKGVFSVKRICSRTRIWPACVALAKNNFICVCIVKRNKRTRDALCGASTCVSVPTASMSILESNGTHAPYSTNDCLYSNATRRKLKLETVCDPQREILRMRANPGWANPLDTENALTAELMAQIFSCTTLCIYYFLPSLPPDLCLPSNRISVAYVCSTEQVVAKLTPDRSSAVRYNAT
jgi:hypothetical protein